MDRATHEARTAQYSEFLGRLAVTRENIERLLSLAPSLDLASSVLVDLSRTLADLASTETHASSHQRQHLSIRPEPSMEDLAEQEWPDNAELRSRAFEAGRRLGFMRVGFDSRDTGTGEAAWKSALLRWRPETVELLLVTVERLEARRAEKDRERVKPLMRPR